ncbi:hypothetical protein BJY52DRAFT_427207 [Lactarius psammicola]|nr:hypothetical protein BJY52DRAFT_427207 [Lactarius psammicola]
MRDQMDTERRTAWGAATKAGSEWARDGRDLSLIPARRAREPTVRPAAVWMYVSSRSHARAHVAGWTAASNTPIMYHHRESADTASTTTPGSICGDGGGGGNNGCSGAWPLTATHLSAAIAPRSGVALSSSPSDVRLSSASASVAVASVCSESSNSSSSSSSSPSSSLDSTRSPSPPSICSGANGDVGVGKPIAGGGGGGVGGGNNVTQEGCEARYRSELGRGGISPRNARRDLFSSFFSSR